MKITIPAYAKINLFLEVLDKRPDGYHNIDTIMHTIPLHDMLTISAVPARETAVTLTCSCPRTPIGQGNTAYRAAEAFCSAAGVALAVEIHIEKHIPSEAGLGGASADAAAVLHGLNQLAGFPLSTATLCAVGGTIGADVPFCVMGGCARATGIGEVLTPLPTLPPCHIVIGKGGAGVSTAQAYAGLPPRAEYKDSTLFATALSAGNLQEMSLHAYNAFESVMVEDSRAIKAMLAEQGAVISMLSGSGAAVFGLFDCPERANKATERLLASGYFAYKELV